MGGGGQMPTMPGGGMPSAEQMKQAQEYAF